LATRIDRDFTFQAAVHFEGKFILNYYDVTLSMDVQTESIKEQNIAMDRILYFLSESLSNSVFIHDQETKMIEKYNQAGIKTCILPEEPYDQIITVLLLMKFNAITEGKLLVTDIALISVLSDQVRFLYDLETANSHPFGKGWWSEPTTSISDIVKHNKKDKIVKLVKSCDWSNIGLDWNAKPIKPTEIIFSNESEKQP
jgi:hypothetical protein